MLRNYFTINSQLDKQQAFIKYQLLKRREGEKETQRKKQPRNVILALRKLAVWLRGQPYTNLRILLKEQITIFDYQHVQAVL